MADEYKHKGCVVCCVCSCMLAQWRATVVVVFHCITWFQTQLIFASRQFRYPSQLWDLCSAAHH